jgi:hypothetical protein
VDTITEMRELWALQQLKARYFRFIDTKCWAEWLDLFAPDATLQADWAASTLGRDGKTGEKFEGVAAIGAYVVPLLDKAHTVHQGHTPELTIHSSTAASGIWPMEDIVEHADVTIHGFGHYHETYRKIDGAWKIASLHLTRTRISTTYR